MTRLLLALVVAFGVGLGPARAGDGPSAAIERVIADQLAAFQRDDFAAAFAHASPGIRQKFRTAENFGRMVRSGYPMIYRPARVEWRGLETTPRGGHRQVVLFEDGAGRLYEAEYLMGEFDGVWRIQGVRLRELPGLAS